MEIAIVGGGASGLVAAIKAKTKKNKVTIFESNNVCGKKVLLTGNGKCNYFNDDFNTEHYHSSNIELLEQIITKENKEKVLNFFNSIGIVPKVKNGYYYPMSNQAITIKEALVFEAQLNGVRIIYDIEVKDISYDTKFNLYTSKGVYIADKVILATGSKAAPKTGSKGLGYSLAQKFNHNIIKPLPALVQLKGQEKYFKDWAGIRAEVNVSVMENGTIVKTSTGEIQLTDYGVSGICIFQLSGYIIRELDKGKQKEIIINFLPWLEEGCLSYLEKRNEVVKNRTISQLLDGLLNYKLVNLILKKSNVDGTKTLADLSLIQKKTIVSNLQGFKLNITGFNDFDKAQVCSGGVPLLEININTMESKYQKGLYIIGELLDVDGECGGYNLGFAWLSGLIAGSAIKEIL